MFGTGFFVSGRERMLAAIFQLRWLKGVADRRIQLWSRLQLLRLGEGMRPGAVDCELNQRKLRKERRKDDKQRAKLRATRSEGEREQRSIWRLFFRIFLRYWPE